MGSRGGGSEEMWCKINSLMYRRLHSFDSFNQACILGGPNNMAARRGKGGGRTWRHERMIVGLGC